MKRRKRRIMAILLVFAMLFTMVDPSMFGGVITAQAEESVKKGWDDENNKKIYYIGSSENLKHVADNYANEDDEGVALRGATYEVTTNITLGEWAANGVNIGTSTHKFSNTFNGNGYTISGLKYNEKIGTMGGLFSYLNGATIKDLIIDGAQIRSNQYGGVLAARAENAKIQNVTIINSKCKVASLGAIVGLITTGGLYGGALVGYANNTKIYNCESRNTVVEVDTTGGVQALGGDGMYMGGLVGWMDNGSIIEYSRVIGGTEGKVETKYEIAVGALAANNLYAGGIVGRLDGNGSAPTQILDCFSDTDVNFHGANYVSVGSGISGYAGGIAARVSGSNYEMERCHYAGKLSSYLLNSVLVLPIIPMEDYYLGGIAGNVEDSSKIHNCYFNWEKAIQDNTRKKVPAIYGESNRGDVTTIGDAQYSNSTFFVGFDFDGTDEEKLRDTNNNELLGGPHYNKWVINRATNMPVHGNIVYAETDFPGAGTISFAATSIQEEKKTDGWTKEEKPDDELANGISISQIAQTYSDMNEEVILTATTNQGYNFKGWYLKGSESSNPISTELVLTLGGTKENSYQYKDGDVFVAKYTANVTFWKELNETDETESGYNGYSSPDVVECTYEQVLDPNETSTSKEGCIFLGWTETDLTSETSIASGIDKKQLTSDKIDATGLIKDPILITRPVTLYPVFIEFGNYNIKVQMQSAELEDGSNYIKGKEGLEGNAIASVDTNGNLFISIDEKKDQDGKSVITLNNGYRFDGWYEVSENNPEGTLVSRSKTYYPSDVNTEHRYEARYQYKITAYIPARSRANHLSYKKESSKFGEFYVGYGVNINDNGVIVEPGFYSKEVLFMYWTDDISGIKMSTLYENEFEWDEMYDEADKSIPEIYIKEPVSIYAIVDWNSGKYDSYHPVVAKTDFPAGTINAKITDASTDDTLPIQNGSITMELEIKEGYNLEDLRKYASRDNGESWGANTTVASDEQKKLTDGKLSWTTYPGISTYHNTVIVARLTANINLFDENHLNDPYVIKRKYNSLLFNSVGSPTQNWDIMEEHLADPIYDEPQDVPVGSGDTPSDESMYKDGYKFFGWIKKNEQSETDLGLYTDPLNPFATTNVSAIDGYLLPNDFRITETMDICPVYAKYKFDLKTNFESSNVEGKPVISNYTITNDGELTITLPLVNGYTFQKWEINSESGEIPEFVEKGNDIYTVTIKPETEYTITAVYEATVSFKDAMKDSNGKPSDREENYLYNQPISDKIDKLPISYATVNTEVDKIDMQDGKFNENTYVFVGWKNCPYDSSETEVKDPTLPYEFVSENDPVLGATNMIPVYTKPSISLESNIGTESKATINISKEGTVTLEAPEQEGYVFTGWSLNGEPFAEEDIYTLSPEELRSDKPYKFTANYDILVTYMIPNVNENNELTEEHTSMQAPIPKGEAIGDGQYSVAPTIAAMSALEKAGYIFGGWAKEGESTEYTSEITEPITLYPLTNQAKISMYSNIDNVVTTITIGQEDGKIIFPGEPSELSSSKDELPDGISMTSKNNTEIETSFIGYSLVEITTDEQGNEVSRTSKALYKAGDSIPAKELSTYNTTGNYRIYAVWSQIQNISEASIYVDESKSLDGLCTAAAVNTKILRNAGLQDSEAKYERHILYSKNSKYTDVKTANGIDWNNTLYKQYFDKDYEVADENWDVYVSLLYNIKDNTQEYGVCPYLKFFYTSEKQGNFRDETDPTWEHKLKDVADNLLNKTDKEKYSWNTYIDRIKQYAEVK